MSAGLVIVGGSYAAAQIAASARQAGFAEPITLVSEEEVLPYQRPPLSKGFLTGAAAESSLPIRAEAFYKEQQVVLELGTRVEAIDRPARRVLLAGGRSLPYGRLALATGARPRRLALAGAELDGVLYLRSLRDARVLKERLGSAQSVVVIGGGFIGLEVASACVALGRRVAVVEVQPRLMARAVPALLGEYFARLHRSRGVDLRLAAGLARIEGSDAHVRGVALEDGQVLPADVVLAGVGVLPNTELAQAGGLACDDGIVVDRFARTSDPDIVAAGDCTRFPCAYGDAPLRLESVQNAMDQARSAGAALAGRETPHEAVPWFWSDQYDTKLQMAGLSAGHDAHAVRGSMEEGRFTVYYLRGGRLVGADSVGRPAEHMLARKLVAARVALTPAQAADASFDLKSLLPAG